eukprot:6208657-Pleurochrysis_carterae.AAC.3
MLYGGSLAVITTAPCVSSPSTESNFVRSRDRLERRMPPSPAAAGAVLGGSDGAMLKTSLLQALALL